MDRYFLRSDVHLKVIYDDKNKFGSPITEKPEWAVRRLFFPIIELVQEKGYSSLKEARLLLKDILSSKMFSKFGTLRDDSSWDLHKEVLYPDPSLSQPQKLLLLREDFNRKIELDLPASHWKLIHEIISKLEADGVPVSHDGLHPDMEHLINGLLEADFIFLAKEYPKPDNWCKKQNFTFLGHNTVLVSTQSTTLIIDPLIFATSKENPGKYQPFQIREIGPVEAILITHSHPDHFDPATLLRFPPDTKIIIPRCDKETILSANMKYRLEELGFKNILTMDWNDSEKIGDINIIAQPFYGEQPTDNDMLHPSIRNEGNTYLVQTPIYSAIFLADSGFDGQGNVLDLAINLRKRLGSIDFVFSGYRGWLLYPIQYLFSSVARYLLFVPPIQWNIRQQIMLTAEQAVDVAERLGAKYLIPYADGGAPWHWKIGLGPRLDGKGKEIMGFDYFPERVDQVANNRTELIDGSKMGSSVKTLVMRPNQSISISPDGKPTIVSMEENQWPF